MYRASGTVKVAWRSSFDARGVELDSLMAFEWAMSGEVTCRLLVSACLPACLLERYGPGERRRRFCDNDLTILMGCCDRRMEPLW